MCMTLTLTFGVGQGPIAICQSKEYMLVLIWWQLYCNLYYLLPFMRYSQLKCAWSWCWHWNCPRSNVNMRNICSINQSLWDIHSRNANDLDLSNGPKWNVSIPIERACKSFHLIIHCLSPFPRYSQINEMPKILPWKWMSRSTRKKTGLGEFVNFSRILAAPAI